VPAQVQARLTESGADVRNLTGEAGAGIHPLMWRFLVADDPEVDRFLVRDADSLLSEREQAAVREWTASSFWFHHMRDYFTHTDLILAGLWGGCRGALPQLRPLMLSWLARQNQTARTVDQDFLRETVWPFVRQSVLNHDELFGFHNPRPFPAHEPVRWSTEQFHVGSNVSFNGIEGASKLEDGALQNWAIFHRDGRSLCEYSSPVKGRKWRADLPIFMIEGIVSGELIAKVLN
jgi:hypothetical protein